MIPTQAKVTVGQVFNIGNYQSVRVETALEAIPEKDETIEQVFERAFLEAKKAFKKCSANFVPKKAEGGK